MSQPYIGGMKSSKIYAHESPDRAIAPSEETSNMGHNLYWSQSVSGELVTKIVDSNFP
ncbi:hypothetical protein [Pleurocapsa sp. PCC 7327]|uniref:hypothetical protein n=1 Tax=Pleurocapsa sp. PCC 7327 TaxID=118163 RepID=UPI0016415FF6|nr:hypothetical protein [Pleurocapsa sp. PCC 7327]